MRLVSIPSDFVFEKLTLPVDRRPVDPPPVVEMQTYNVDLK